MTSISARKNDHTKNFYPMISRFVILLGLLFFLALSVNSQSNWKYISPVPGSKFVNPKNNIAIRHGDQFGKDEVDHLNIEVVGSQSGLASGKIRLSNELRTVIFNPGRSFHPGETVTVSIINSPKTLMGKQLNDTSFSFQISRQPNVSHQTKTDSDHLNPQKQHVNNTENKRQSTLINVGDQLPEDLPPLQITKHNNPANGYLFLTSGANDNYSNYIRIVDNTGTPIFYRKFQNSVRDFKVAEGNRLLHFYSDYSGPSQNCYLVLDAAYQAIDTLKMENGYFVDNHEALLLENGNRLMMAYDAQLVGMDTVVPGGDPLATVVGLVIQEIDSSDNVILQWRSWDHFAITDAVGIDFTAQYIDYVHGNSIEVDNDGNLIISSRHMNEITKIDRTTGGIIWRFGPNAKNNMFSIAYDTVGFSYQHDARRTPSGSLTIYDNGNLHDPQFSQAVEYTLDETNMVAERIWNYENNPVIYASATGSTRRLDNGNTFIGWGSVSPGSPIITEVTQDGVITLEAYYPNWVHSYRVIKEEWETTAFDFDTDSLIFEPLQPGDTSLQKLSVSNNLDYQIQINNLISPTGLFNPAGEFPLAIPAGETGELFVEFTSDSTGMFDDLLTICHDIENDTVTQRIAKQINAFVEVSEDANIAETNASRLIVYPNPVSEIVNIGFRNRPGTKSIEMMGVHGKTSLQVITENDEVNLNISKYPSGIYVLRVTFSDGEMILKKILKQ